MSEQKKDIWQLRREWVRKMKEQERKQKEDKKKRDKE